MNYRFNKIFIGTLVVNQSDGGYYKGEILCKVINDYTVIDILNNKEYSYFEYPSHSSVIDGKAYVSSLHENFPEVLISNIMRKKSLIKLANILNDDWANIEIPEGIVEPIAESKVKKIK